MFLDCFNNICLSYAFLIALLKKKMCFLHILMRHVTFICELYEISYKPIYKNV
jgi:hypothetical protein